jgi:hypothetical protein
VAATTIIKEDNTTDQKAVLLEGVYLLMHASIYFESPFNTELVYFTHTGKCDINKLCAEGGCNT